MTYKILDIIGVKKMFLSGKELEFTGKPELKSIFRHVFVYLL